MEIIPLRTQPAENKNISEMSMDCSQWKQSFSFSFAQIVGSVVSILGWTSSYYAVVVVFVPSKLLFVAQMCSIKDTFLSGHHTMGNAL